jgi:8-oxo-dGTP pyrophosphatase MutT (NUDIX family)
MRAFGALPAWLRRVLVRLGAPSYTVGAVLVLRRPDRSVLLVDQRHTGGWALPGGLLKRGEEPVDALVREVREEVGVRLDPDELPPPRALIAPKEQRVDLVFVLDTEDGRDAHLADPAEVRRIGWFLPDALPDVTDPARFVLDAALRW